MSGDTIELDGTQIYRQLIAYNARRDLHRQVKQRQQPTINESLQRILDDLRVVIDVGVTNLHTKLSTRTDPHQSSVRNLTPTKPETSDLHSQLQRITQRVHELIRTHARQIQLSLSNCQRCHRTASLIGLVASRVRTAPVPSPLKVPGEGTVGGVA